MVMIEKYILQLTDYARVCGLIDEEDVRYTINRLLELFALDELSDEAVASYESEPAILDRAAAEDALEGILAGMLDYAVGAELIPEDTVTYRDLFDTKIMGQLVPRPGQVVSEFKKRYERSPLEATDYFYTLSCDSDYIRRYRIKKDLKWTTDTDFGTLDITVNLSKPEKDPKAIAAAKLAKQSGYPKCLLCKENEGYAGRINHPARQNHRIIPVTINGSDWYFQYSPYVYYNEHCIVFNAVHTPMKIERATFGKLLDFVEQFPHYFVGSNADLPIVGGSILSHDHFQGGHYEFAMAKAPIEREITFGGFEDVNAGIVKWPMSVIRISSPEKERLIELADKILIAWRGYTDEAAFIFAETDGETHNTITPIARKRGDEYELDLVLRNNITTDEHPLGVYHPHAKLHHIKKENIGLIEVMGLAVLPSRLKEEMADLEQALLDGRSIRADEELSKHADWVEEFLPRYGYTVGSALDGEVEPSKLHEIVQHEIGLVFLEVLKDSGVYKCTKEGRAAFAKFIDHVNR
jgi:UDPglucose--hexose-1-phosphate uridylyltransferase